VVPARDWSGTEVYDLAGYLRAFGRVSPSDRGYQSVAVAHINAKRSIDLEISGLIRLRRDMGVGAGHAALALRGADEEGCRPTSISKPAARALYQHLGFHSPAVDLPTVHRGQHCGGLFFYF